MQQAMAEEMDTDPYHGDSTSKTPEPEPQEAEEVSHVYCHHLPFVLLSFQLETFLWDVANELICFELLDCSRKVRLRHM